MRPTLPIPLLFRALFALCLASAVYGEALENVEKRDGAYVLKQAPKVEGVFLLQQGAWPEDVIKAFHETPFLDGASIRLKWAELEPEDQKFDWTAIEKVFDEVRKWNAAHSQEQPRTMQIRVMAGVHSPKWFEQAGVRYYDTWVEEGMAKKHQNLHIPMPYDNPEFLKQLREVYRAMLERYKDDPLMVMYHGTWSAGPWDEIFHPKGDAPLPPDHSSQKFIDGMKEQLDVIIEEISLKGKPAELPWSGHQPPFDVQGPLRERVVERLGRRSPFFYAQGNGWGANHKWIPQPNKGKDVFDLMYGYQAVGSNAGKGWFPQGDWIPLVRIAEENQVPYVEIYPPDVMPIDDAHNMTQAFLYSPESTATTKPETSPAFEGYRSWLRSRNVPMYFREGKVVFRFWSVNRERVHVGKVKVDAETPLGTAISTRVRGTNGDQWSLWIEAKEANLLKKMHVEVEVTMHTDDGWRTPVVNSIALGEEWRESE